MSDNEPQPRPMIERVQEYLEEQELSALAMDGYDDAICGVVEVGDQTHVVYNRRKCIDILISQGMSDEEAEDHFCYNTLRAISYMQSQGVIPLILDDLDEMA